MATRNLAIISLALDTGLRSSELCALKMQSLDLTDRCTFVLRKMQRWHAPLFSRVTEERIRQWLTVRVGIAKPGVGNVFIGVGGKNPGWGLTTVGIRCIMIKVAREAGVKHFSPHALRRTMATIMIRNGAPTHLVQAQGDWSNSSMLENYTRDINPEDIAPFFATS
jgi:integrase